MLICAIHTCVHYEHVCLLCTDDFEQVFLQTINSLPSLRDINETHAVLLNKMKMSLPQLHAEVFPTDPAAAAKPAPAAATTQ